MQSAVLSQEGRRVGAFPVNGAGQHPRAPTACHTADIIKPGICLALLRNKAVPNSTFRPMADKAELLSGVGRQAPCCASFEVYVARPEGADIRR